MLEVPKLDDLSYETLVDRARAKIPTLTDEWTDLNDHDPGMTTLQVFAWLCDSLNYYINATGEPHRLRFLKLLGIVPRHGAARCPIAAEAPSGTFMNLPRGTRLAAGDTVFELAESLRQKANALLYLYGEETGRVQDLTAFAGQDGGFAPVLAEHASGESAVYFGFEEPLEGELRLFFEVEQSGRNPFDDQFHLVGLVWEYCCGNRWAAAEVISDMTCGLLRSGFLTIHLRESTQMTVSGNMRPAHYLRCRLEEGSCYDMRPRLGRVTLSCAEAVQTDTLVESTQLIYSGDGPLTIDYAVGERDLVSVAVAEGDTWREWFHHSPASTDLCAVEAGSGDGRAIWFDEVRFGQAPAAGTAVLVTVTREGAVEALELGETDGCAESGLALDIDDLYELRLALWKPGAEGRRVLWLYEEYDDLALAGPEDRAFRRDTREGRLLFGDGVHGVQPEAGLRVEAVTLKRSRLDGGNVMRGQINRFCGADAGEVTVSSLENADGGQRMRTFRELEPELERKLRAVTRAVTNEDIRALVMATPGLLIDSVAVIPMRDYCRATGADFVPNTVVVAVKPKSSLPLPRLSDDYRRIIRENLEGYRLLTTDLWVIPARYVGINVYGRIVLRDNNEAGRRQVLDMLADLVDGTATGAFGRGVDFGRMLSALENLPEVRSAASLSLEYVGAGGWKNGHGDIVLHPDSLAYLHETGIEFK